MSKVRTILKRVVSHSSFPAIAVFVISIIVLATVSRCSDIMVDDAAKDIASSLTTTTTSGSTTTHTTETTTKTTTSSTTTKTTESTTSKSTTTTQPQTTKQITTTVVQYTEPEISEPIVNETPEVSEDVYVPDPTENSSEEDSTGTYLGWYEGTWYCAVDMGYTSQPYGASGRYLETAYSVASNSIPQGSIIRVVGAGLDGIYRVDDRGGMANNVVDFYYWDRSSVPSSFLTAGRVGIEVYLIE